MLNALGTLSNVRCLPKACIPSINSCLVFRFTSLRKYSFNSCQRFSIGLQSGDSAGVRHQFTWFSSRNFFAAFEVCFGLLSAMNRCVSGYTSRRNGNSVYSRTWMYKSTSIIPSKIHMPILSCRLIPAQMWTLTGCLALQTLTSRNHKLTRNHGKQGGTKWNHDSIEAASCLAPWWLPNLSMDRAIYTCTRVHSVTTNSTLKHYSTLALASVVLLASYSKRFPTKLNTRQSTRCSWSCRWGTAVPKEGA